MSTTDSTPHSTTDITTLEALRALYAAPKERAVRKQLSALDVHCQRFIGLSPFVVLATAGAAGSLDASPRGGAPGFVQCLDAHTLLIPDAPGNNRLDTLENIVATGHLGLLFLVPGVDETLRVNGRAVLSRAPDDIARCSTEKRAPVLVIRVTVQEAYLHCAKALMRSALWSPQALVDRAVLPTAGQMLMDHTGIQTAPETQEEMVRRYQPDL
jgi:PPOX class probable FMN-dependent enzyme